MPATNVAITPPAPTSPLNYKPVKGELRMVEGRLWRWTGGDWEAATADARDVSGDATLQSVTAQTVVGEQSVVAGRAATESSSAVVSLVRGSLYVIGDLTVTGSGLPKIVDHRRYTTLSAQTLDTSDEIVMNGEELYFVYKAGHKYLYQVRAYYACDTAAATWRVSAKTPSTTEPTTATGNMYQEYVQFNTSQPLGGVYIKIDAWLPENLVDGTLYFVAWSIERYSPDSAGISVTRTVSTSRPQTHYLIDYGV